MLFVESRASAALDKGDGETQSVGKPVSVKGKVAEVLDRHTVAINKGKDDGVECGQILCIARDVIDPDTGMSLGGYEKLQVKVVDVFPRFCVAETYRIAPACTSVQAVVTVNVGDEVYPYKRCACGDCG